jgi:hypothetical protein
MSTPQQNGKPARRSPYYDRWWQSCAASAMKVLADRGEAFTADDLRSDEFALADPHHPSAWGSVFSIAQQRGLIRRLEPTRSHTPSRHHGSLHLWIGAAQRRTHDQS